MALANKHGEASQRVFYSKFDGGLNLAIPAESMSLNELRQALNVEFSSITGSMRVRGGLVWSGRFASKISDMVPVAGKRGFLARLDDGTAQYFTWNCTWDVTGSFTGDSSLSIAPWGDNAFLVASGGKLQLFEPMAENTGIPTLTTLTDSPDNCRLTFVKEGRAGVVDGPDTLRFSWVGDCERWTTDADETQKLIDDYNARRDAAIAAGEDFTEEMPGAIDDDSMGQFLEIGYKDGMDIVAVVPLSKDLIIFKTPGSEPDRGTIFRLTGEFPDWQVLEAAHNTGTFSQNSVQAVANDVFYLSPSGLANLSSVTAYGDVKSSWPDRKVANTLAQDLNENSRLWNVPDKQQLWIQTNPREKLLWIFDYYRGIWTQFEFPIVPVYADGLGVKTYLASGDSIYHINDWYTQDEPDINNNPVQIKAKMQMGTVLKGLQTLIKAAFASFIADPSCTAYLKLKGFKMPLKAGGTPEYIFEDTDIAFDDTDPLFPEGNVMTARQRCIVRDWAIVPEIEIAGGGFSFATIGLDVVEV